MDSYENIKGRHVIVTNKKTRKLDIADRVFYVKLAAGTMVHGGFITANKDVTIRRTSVERLATDEEIEQARNKFWKSIKDEVCTCGHLKSEHTGLNGHGACTVEKCGCIQFTWASWVI